MTGILRTGNGVSCALAAALLLALPGAAAAQKSGVKLQEELEAGEADEGDGPEAPSGPAAAHAEGDYGGVVPGKPRKSGFKPGKGKRPIVSWIGHVPRGSGSRLFVQLTKSTDHAQQVVGRELVVTIRGARFGSSNERRRLDTRFFPTSVAQVVPRAARGGVALHIQFKNPADAATAPAQLSQEQDGYYYLYLDFGAGATPPDSK
jgi:hypothetical protein